MIFKQEKPKRAQRVATAENINPRMNISQSMTVSRDQRKYTVVLCLANRTIKKTFLSELSALNQMDINRSLYKKPGTER